MVNSGLARIVLVSLVGVSRDLASVFLWGLNPFSISCCMPSQQLLHSVARFFDAARRTVVATLLAYVCRRAPQESVRYNTHQPLLEGSF